MNATLLVKGGLVVVRQNPGSRGLGREVHLEIRSRVAGGESWRFVAREMDVSMETIRRVLRKAGPVPPRWKARAGNHLSLEQREEIRVGLEREESFRTIAKRLGCAPSTVSREVERNGGRAGYRAFRADNRAYAMARRPKPRKLVDSAALADEVNKGLRQRWSPEEIAGRLLVDFPDRPEMRVSPETIYQTLFLQAKGRLKTELVLNLRRGRVQRRPRQRTTVGSIGKMSAMVMISERPAEIEDRAVPGHWEGDLIIGANNASAVATIVERTSRYLLLVELVNGKTAEDVCDAVAAKIIELPVQLRRSLTWDQGTEMASHVRFTIATGVQVYFCDPHSPWQRGTNENTNGLLREYFPKGTDLSRFTQSDLDAVAHEINGRPRQTLGWMKPSEALAELVAPTD